MIALYADFNNRTPEGGCWILQHEGADIDVNASSLGLSPGDRVLLYQDEGGFEVAASLAFKFVESVGRETWVAFPDWSTMTRAYSPNAPAAGMHTSRVA